MKTTMNIRKMRKNTRKENLHMTQHENVYILGHKNPDTDSICSAIAYADIRNRTSTGDHFKI